LNSGIGCYRLAAMNPLPPLLAFWCLLFSGW